MIDSKKPSLVPPINVPNPAQSRTMEVAEAAGKPMAQTSSRHLRFQQHAVISKARNRMFSPSELRKATRYQLTSTAVIRWLGTDQVLHEAEGVVHDISTCGVFVESTAPLLLRANVELEIAPSNLQLCGAGPSLHFEGRVVRTEKYRKRLGFGIRRRRIPIRLRTQQRSWLIHGPQIVTASPGGNS